MKFALQFVNLHLVACDLYYDSKYAAHSTDSTWTADSLLANTARFIFHMLHVATGLSCFHEKGHSDNAFNEIADTLCTRLADTLDFQGADTEFTPAFEFAENPLMAQWAFILLLKPTARSQYPI